MVEEWMANEGSLFQRTLQRCKREVQEALESDRNLGELCTFTIRGRVKSVFSSVKKLLKVRGVSKDDLKAEAVKDLLALEVVVNPDPEAEVPENPDWLANEW